MALEVLTREKVMLDAKAELCRRRERGKSSQRAFRQRQSAAVQKLKEEHERLKDLIAEIVDSAKVDDLAQLKTAIINAGGAAGLDVSGIILDNRQDSGRTFDETSTWPRPFVIALSIDQEELSSNAPAKPSTYAEQNNLALYNAQTLEDDDVPHIGSEYGASRQYVHSGRMSPRFDYGLWPKPDRYDKIIQPPLDIVPYLGANMHTIAGKINWACLDYGYAWLQEAFRKQPDTSTLSDQLSADYPRSLPSNPAVRALFDRLFRHSKPLHDVPYVMAMIEARIEFRRFGHVRGDHPGANVETSQMLRRRILEDYLIRGVKMNEWWTPLDVERYIEEKMGCYAFIPFQAAISCEHGNSAQMKILHPLIRALVESSICFGDGPRWRADHSTRVVNAWLCAIGKFG